MTIKLLKIFLWIYYYIYKISNNNCEGQYLLTICCIVYYNFLFIINVVVKANDYSMKYIIAKVMFPVVNETANNENPFLFAIVRIGDSQGGGVQ